MRRSWCALLVATAALVVPAAPVMAQAVTVPPNPGDFVLDIDPATPTPAADSMPTCDPSIESIAQSFMTGQTSVTANCTYATVVSQQRQTGTVSNARLATSTGDAGFNSGTVDASCDVNLATTMSMTISLQGMSPSMNMTAFNGTVQQACAFTLAFSDAARSTITGTIEANARLGRGTGSAAGDTISIDINANVYVTGGTGAFAGYTGSGTFSQTEEIEVPLNSGGSVTTGPPTTTAPDLTGVCGYMPGLSECSAAGVQAWCAANGSTPAGQQICGALGNVLGKASSISLSSMSLMSGGDVMKLRLTKKPGAARIISPAPPAGTPTAAAAVTARSKVRVAATAGSTCTVTTNRGVLVGSARANKQAIATITPRSNSLRGASSLVASCTLKGKTFNSNRVKISL